MSLAERARLGSGLPLGLPSAFWEEHPRRAVACDSPSAQPQSSTAVLSVCQALPWRPRLVLDGRTRYTLGGEGGRISSYDEAWGITPSEALWMLVKPFSE